MQDLGSSTEPSGVTLSKPLLFLPFFPYLGIKTSFHLKLENCTTVRTSRVVTRFDMGKQTLSVSADLMKFSAFPCKSYFSPISIGSYNSTTVMILISFVKHWDLMKKSTILNCLISSNWDHQSDSPQSNCLGAARRKSWHVLVYISQLPLVWICRLLKVQCNV